MSKRKNKDNADQERKGIVGLGGLSDALDDWREDGGLAGLVGEVQVQHSIAPGAGLDPIGWMRENPIITAIGAVGAGLAIKKLAE